MQLHVLSMTESPGCCDVTRAMEAAEARPRSQPPPYPPQCPAWPRSPPLRLLLCLCPPVLSGPQGWVVAGELVTHSPACSPGAVTAATRGVRRLWLEQTV